jgi:hypothetical protein
MQRLEIFHASASGLAYAGGGCPSIVLRGLDPRIHLLPKKLFPKMDGLPGQARQ